MYSGIEPLWTTLDSSATYNILESVKSVGRMLAMLITR